MLEIHWAMYLMVLGLMFMIGYSNGSMRERRRQIKRDALRRKHERALDAIRRGEIDWTEYIPDRDGPERY